jgi:hypothetical protein
MLKTEEIDTIIKEYQKNSKILIKENEEKEKKDKKKPTYFPKDFLKKIYTDIEHNFETNRLFKPADSYITFLENNDLKDSSSIKKCYKNIYYQIKNKKYYVNDR